MKLRTYRYFVVLLALTLAMAGGFWLRGARAGATFVVNSNSDVNANDVNPGDGICKTATAGVNECTLRAAIQEANASSVLDTITFGLPGGNTNPQITLTTALPLITAPVIIDGNTGGATRVQIVGISAGANVQGLTLDFGGGGSQIKSLVIRNFTRAGIVIVSNGNAIQNCYIGTDAAGATDQGNTLLGVLINGGDNNLIGGTGAGNVISGNDAVGVLLANEATGNVISGNFIGTNATGTLPLGNSGAGVDIESASANNVVGGTSAGERNVISGNGGNGVLFTDGANGNKVQGNFIGTDVNGAAAIGNGFAGVALQAPNNTVGGTTPSARNIISGNNREGVYISGSGNQVQGNYIGTNAAGTAALANGLQGVRIQGGPGNTIGGTAAGARNLISGNNSNGVQIDGSAATSNQIQGNFIGSNVNGAVAVANGAAGVALLAPNNTVGGTTFGSRNIISGNNREGVYISASGNLVQGNFIGTNASGTAALSNILLGIDIANAPNNKIGGTDADDGAMDGIVMARNIISGNIGNGIVFTTSGVHIGGAAATGNLVQGNFIGTDVTGTAELGNYLNGIYIEGAPNNMIGGTAPGARNVISGNDVGVFISGGAGNQVQGNFIGTDVTGTKALGNNEHGISIAGGSINCIVGGTVAGTGNLISGNRFDGLDIVQGATTGTLVQGNFIGTDVTGTADLGNGLDGLTITASHSTIGGATAAARNIISGNNEFGIFISGDGSNQIQGNFIGTDVTGTNALGNSLDGLWIQNTSKNIIGGTGLGNTIAFNGGLGIRLRTYQGGLINGNAILGNSIFSNGLLGIDLNEDGVTANDAGDADTGPNNLQNYPVITSAVSNPANNTTAVQGTLNSTANTTFTIEFFSSALPDPTGFGEGQTFRGSTTLTTNSSGNITFNVTLNAAIPGGHVITATATDSSNNTSEFSQAVIVTAPTFTISGQITNSQGGAALGAVSVNLTGSQTATTQTNLNGTYSFNVMGGGNYTVTPSKANFSFNPLSQTFNNLSANVVANFVGSMTLTILVEEGTVNQAVALDSVTHVRGPFHILTEHNFGADHHTRVILFTSDLGLTQPDPSKLTVTAGGVLLTVENVGPLTGVPGLIASYIIVVLPDGLTPGDLPLSVTLNGVASTNSPTLAISP